MRTSAPCHRCLASRNDCGDGWLTAPCKVEDERFDISRLGGHWEGPLWKLVTERPGHLLDASHSSWVEALFSVVDSTIEYFENELGGNLEDQIWGARNTAAIRHPLSSAVQALARWLDMPAPAAA